MVSMIFPPELIDWMDKQLNKRDPHANSIEHCVSFDFEVTKEGSEQARDVATIFMHHEYDEV